tara:strand:- start:5730 stop:6245 length:516 start_codon:yes stop_codon:yes gene_type:complete
VKNILVFFLFLFCLSCSSSSNNKKTTISLDCPQVLYSTEDNQYVDTDGDILTVENFSFKAEINNHAFYSSCTIAENVNSFPLEILFIVKPLSISSNEIILPVYSALLDNEDRVIDVQYFSIDGQMNKDFETENYIETELSKKINIITKTQVEISKIIIGFMLDKKRKEFLN